jgi:hypothetical protein
MFTASTVVNVLLRQTPGLAGGFFLNIASSYAYERWKTRIQRQTYKSLVGIWVESNDILHDRPFAISEFSFAPDGHLRFGGVSYDNAGHEFYRWNSLLLDIQDDRLWYIYDTSPIAMEPTKDQGFGCMTLYYDNAHNAWNAHTGYFLDMAEAKPRHTRMLRFDAVAAALKRQLNAYDPRDKQFMINELLSLKDNDSIRSLFGWPPNQ